MAREPFGAESLDLANEGLGVGRLGAAHVRAHVGRSPCRYTQIASAEREARRGSRSPDPMSTNIAAGSQHDNPRKPGNRRSVPPISRERPEEDLVIQRNGRGASEALMALAAQVPSCGLGPVADLELAKDALDM